MPVKLNPGVVAHVPVQQLERDPQQPRQSFDKDSLKRLGASLKRRVLHPLLVRQVGKQIIITDGERRMRAAKLVGIEKLPCLLDERKDDGDEAQARIDRAVDQITTSTERESLNPMDLAEWLVRMQRNEKKSANEMLAELAKRGITDMRATGLDKLMKLTELPDWTKEMVREGTLTETHAAAAVPAIGHPKVLSNIKKRIADDIKWKGSVTAKEVGHFVEDGFRREGINLNDDWQGGKADLVRAFPITVCHGCEFYKKIGSTEVCMNAKEFKRKNTEALKLKAEREARKAEKAAAKAKPAKKSKFDKALEASVAEERAESSKENLRQYLEEWLRPVVTAQAPKRMSQNQQTAILLWLATGAIDFVTSWGGGQQEKQAAEATLPFLKEIKVRDLPELMTFATTTYGPPHLAKLVAAAVDVLTRDQLRWLAHYLKIELTDAETAYRIDAEYLRLKRKAHLQEMARAAGLETVKGMGVPALKEALLKPEAIAAIGVPFELGDIYREPFAVADAEDDPLEDLEDIGDEMVCIECGCSHMDPCEGGCGWLKQDGRANVGLCTACPGGLKRWRRGERNLSEAAEQYVDERDQMRGKEPTPKALADHDLGDAGAEIAAAADTAPKKKASKRKVK